MPYGNRAAPQNGDRPLHSDRAVPHQIKASDSDDIYFNDEDNAALLAIDDSAINGAESSTRGSAQGRGASAGRDVTSESSRGVGTRPQAATSVNLPTTNH